MCNVCVHMSMYTEVLEILSQQKFDLQKGKSGPYWNQLNIWKCLLKFREPESCRGSESSSQLVFFNLDQKKTAIYAGLAPLSNSTSGLLAKTNVSLALASHH